MLSYLPLISLLVCACAMTSTLSSVPVNIINQLITHFGGNEKAVFIVQFGISISSFITGMTSLYLSYNTNWHGKSILIKGLLILGLAGFLSGLTTNPYLFLLLRSLLGVGCAMTFAGSLHIMRHTLPYEKHGNFYAMNSLLISINMIVVALFAKFLMSHNKPLYLFGYYLLALIPSYFVFKIIKNPVEHSVSQDNIIDDNDKPSIFEQIKFWAGFIAVFSITCSFNVILLNIPILIQDLQMTQKITTIFMILYSVFGIIFSFISARLMNIVGNRRVFLIGILFLIFGLKTLSIASNENWFYLGIIFTGSAAGLSFVNFTPFVQSLVNKGKMRFATNMCTAAIYFGFFFASIFSYLVRVYSSGGISDIIHINYLLMLVIAGLMVALFFKRQ